MIVRIILMAFAAKILDGAMIALGACMTLRIFGVI
jgi:hypothetical protein